MKNILKIVLFSIALGTAGCVSKIDKSISEYHAVADQVELGDSKEKVLSILFPTQQRLEHSGSKPPDQHFKGDVKVEIYYMRSRRQRDGLTTDDEFVPYVFNDGRLVGIGWQILGGAKSQGQAPDRIYIDNTTTVY